MVEDAFCQIASKIILLRKRIGKRKGQLKNPSAKADPAHEIRVQRSLLSLEGLAIGDALGEMVSAQFQFAKEMIQNRLPNGPWFHTDDAEMAISIVEVLRLYGCIQQEALSGKFAARYEREPYRGYGRMTAIQLREVLRGADWKLTAGNAFDGQGSMGNGAAMRVAPLGGFFADDLERASREAEASAVVTHTHSEGIAGAIAVAIAAALASQCRMGLQTSPPEFLKTVAGRTPQSEVQRGLRLAADIPAGTSIRDVVLSLGNGSRITAQDTVPYALWCAAHYLNDFYNGIVTTISGGGDCDTNAAIVGGIIALNCGLEGIPIEWRQAKEPLRVDLQR